jgi:hypothetical protein
VLFNGIDVKAEAISRELDAIRPPGAHEE